jgi:uncharacterized membrane protein
MDEKQKKFTFLGLTILPFVILFLEVVVLLVESFFYGTFDLSIKLQSSNFLAAFIHWIVTIILWVAGILLLVYISKKLGYNIFENNIKPKIISWVLVAIIVIIVGIVSFYDWEKQFKPYAEFMGSLNRLGNMGIIAFIGQYIYYLVEGILFLAIVIFGQKFGELTFKNEIIPWGGIICGLTWGLGHILTKGNIYIGVFGFFQSIGYGIVYLLLKKNAKLTYIIITIMFVI